MSVRLLASAVTRVFLLPPLSLFILLAAGWLASRRWPRTGRTLMAGAMALLFLLCTEFGSNFLVAPLESMTAPLLAPQDAHAQAIVVLAAGRLERAPEFGGANIPDYIALARLRYAARMQHATDLPLLVSGGNVLASSKAADMAAALREDFRTPVKWIEGRSDTTAENARFSAVLLHQEGVHRILLVTDAMHMPRAQMIFARAGMEVVAAPTMFFGAQGFGPLSMVPSAEGLRRSYYALYEWLGYGWYALAESATPFATLSASPAP